MCTGILLTRSHESTFSKIFTSISTPPVLIFFVVVFLMNFFRQVQIFKFVYLFFFFKNPFFFPIALTFFYRNVKKKNAKQEKYQQCLSFEKRICSLIRFQPKVPPDRPHAGVRAHTHRAPLTALCSTDSSDTRKLFKSCLNKVH